MTLTSTPHLIAAVRAGTTYDEAEALRSTLDWWEQAGVDVTVDDTPRSWLRASPAPSTPSQAVSQIARPATFPDSLDAFTAWLGSPEALPDLGPIRVSPQGAIASGLMILTDMPEKDDVAAGSLFAGPCGLLLDAMLGAIGRDRTSVYLAALSPARPASGRIAESLESELARIARHHVALARPRAVLLMGDATSRAFTGMNFAPARRTIHDINLNGGNVPAIATFHPRFLLQHQAQKADAWADLRMLMEILTK